MIPGRLETEAKLTATGPVDPAAVAAAFAEQDLTLRPLPERVIHDTYLDTADRRLFRAGVALRRREENGRLALTVKALEPPKKGVAVRHELEQRLEGPPARPGRLPGGPVADLLAPVLGTRPLKPLVQLVVRRVPFEVRRGARRVGEVVVDEVRPGGRPAVAGRAPRPGGGPFVEVEFEVEPEAAAEIGPAVERLTDRLPLVPSATSKFERALVWAGLDLPAAGPPRPELVPAPDDRFVDAAYRVFRRHFETLLANEPGTRLGLNPECLHDMRVSTRRLRAAFRTFRNAFSARRLGGFRREFGWLAGRLGEVRDLDVQLLGLPEHRQALREEDRGRLARYEAHLERRRALARRRMLAALDSARYARLVRRFQAFLDRGPVRRPPVEGRRPVVEAARTRLRRSLKKLRARAAEVSPSPQPDQLHAVRLAAKRLRYDAEAFAHLFGKPARRFIGRLVVLQDLLGWHQDQQVAAAALREYVARARPRPSREETFVAGQLIARADHRAAALRKDFRAAWKTFKARTRGKALKRLLRGPKNVPGTLSFQRRSRDPETLAGKGT